MWVKYLILTWPLVNSNSLIFPLKKHLHWLLVVKNLGIFCIVLQIIKERHFRNTLGQILHFVAEETEARKYFLACWKSYRWFLLWSGHRLLTIVLKLLFSYHDAIHVQSQWHCQERRDPKGQKNFQRWISLQWGTLKHKTVQTWKWLFGVPGIP